MTSVSELQLEVRALAPCGAGIGVGQVAVVGDESRGDRRLGVAQIRGARGRVAHVTDGTMTGQSAQAFGLKTWATSAFSRWKRLPSVAAMPADSSAPLERVETQIGDVRGLGMIPDPEETALVVELVVTPCVLEPSSCVLDAASPRSTIVVDPMRSRSVPPPRPEPPPGDGQLRHAWKLSLSTRAHRHQDARGSPRPKNSVWSRRPSATSRRSPSARAR